MWIKKSPQELKSDLYARRLDAGLCVLAVTTLLYLFGIPHAALSVPTSARIVAVLAAGILFLAWHRRARWNQIRSGVWVCEQCNLVKVNHLPGPCICGGTVTPLPQMKWLEVAPCTADRPSEAEMKSAVSLSRAV
jgi:hypothetical protein